MGSWFIVFFLTIQKIQIVSHWIQMLYCVELCEGGEGARIQNPVLTRKSSFVSAFSLLQPEAEMMFDKVCTVHNISFDQK